MEKIFTLLSEVMVIFSIQRVNDGESSPRQLDFFPNQHMLS